MKQVLLSVLMFFGMRSYSQTDFRFDNVAYKTIYPKDLCRFISMYPKVILLDVRSPGEFADTSYKGHLNIGRLKGAINVPLDSLEKKIEKIRKYENDPVIVYCSHSQRSRKASKILEEKGFGQIRNLNGGMTWMNQNVGKEFECGKSLIVSSLPYKNIPAAEAVEMIRNDKELVIIDVRSVTVFEGNDSMEVRNTGRIRNAINIPAAEIKKNLTKLEVYKNRPILVYDNNGTESGGVAGLLYKKGFKKVHHLLGGLSAIYGKDKESLKVRSEILERTPAYTILNVKETVNFLKKNENAVILDVRTREEFNNQSKDPWKNLGRIKKAINIAPDSLDLKLADLEKYKSSKILVYGAPESAVLAKKLKSAGFENVNLLYSGLWEMISAAANIDGFQDIRKLMENYEGMW